MGLATHFRKMARNNAWSNHRLLGAGASLSLPQLDEYVLVFDRERRLDLAEIGLEGPEATP